MNPSTQSNSHEASASQVGRLLDDYFQGLYSGDLEVLSRVFHPLAHYSVLRDGALVHYDMPTYFDVVRNRPSPQSLGEECFYEIVSVDFADENTVSAKMTSSMLGFHFTDFLSLVCVEGEWRILSKLFAARTRANIGDS